MKKTRILSLLLAAVMVFTMLPVSGVWAEPDDVTVYYVDGLVSDYSMTDYVDYGKTLNEAYAPEYLQIPVLNDQDGWHFVGWSEEPCGSRDDVFDADQPLTSDLTLYAIWERELAELTVFLDPGLTSTPGESDLPASAGGWPYRCALSAEGWWRSAEDVKAGEDVLNTDLQSGKTYYGRLEIFPALHYALSEDTEITLRSEYSIVEKQLVATDDGSNELDMIIAYHVPEAPLFYGNVDLFVQTIEPYSYVEWGVDRFCQTAGIRMEQSDSWWTSEADVGDYMKTLDPEDYFEPGRSYYSCFFLSSTNGAALNDAHVSLIGGEVVAVESVVTLNGNELYVVYRVDVPDVENVSVRSSGLEDGFIESPGAFYSDFAPYWMESTNAQLMPTGDHVFTAKPRNDYFFDGWYLVHHNANTEELLSKQLTATLSTAGGDFIVCRFKKAADVELAVCDVTVTDENAADILGDGTFRYADGMLTVNGDCSYPGTIISNRLEGLTVTLTEDATLRNSGERSGRPVLEIAANTVITGDSLLKLRLDGNAVAVSVFNNADFCLQDTRMDVEAYGLALCGNEGKETLTVNHSDLSAKVQPEFAFAINFFGEIILNDCEITVPETALNLNGTIFQGTLEDHRNAKEVVIRANNVEPEGTLLICGVPVTAENAADVLGDGVFAYEEESTTLTVNGNCSYSGTIIDSSIEGLKIRVIGDSILEDTESSAAIMGFALRLSAYTEITGGKLSVRSGKDTGGIRIHDNATLKLDQVDLTVEADMMCIACQPSGDGYAGFVIIDRSDVSLLTRRADISALSFLAGLAVKNVVVVTPEDASFADGALRHVDGSPANEVVIKALPEADLLICNTAVTAENAADVLGDGVFCYDDDLKQLTVNGDCSFNGPVIVSSVENLTIKVAADSCLTDRKIGTFGVQNTIKLLENATITGPGKLTLSSAENASGIFVVNGATLTLDHADLTVHSKNQCLTANEGGEQLRIVASELALHSEPEMASAIAWFDQIELEDCRIVYPANAELVDGNSIVADGMPVHELIISANEVTPSYHTVTFEMNGHGGEPITRVVEDGKPVERPAKPVEEDMLFCGWYLDADGKLAYDFSKPVTADLTLYAKWESLKTPWSFIDVPETSYFFRPIRWAYALQIVNGVSLDRFAPNQICTRGQIMTIIWRAKGSPEPTLQENPFVDVKEGSYYYKAVLWAVENEITKGIDDTHFGPDNSCTRGQAMTFLWRGAGCPDPKSTANPFADVSERKFFYKAVLWAVESGVTKGVSETSFAPNNTCLRGQIVTFLYRQTVGPD